MLSVMGLDGFRPVSLLAQEGSSASTLQGLDSDNPVQELLGNSQRIAEESYLIWNDIWDNFFESSLWTGMVIIALTIAGFSFIAVAFQWLPELASQSFDGRRAFRMFFPIVAITALLQGNAVLLESFLRIVRQIATFLVNLPLKLQLLEVTLADAISGLAAQNAAFAFVARVFSTCDGSLAADYEQCLRNAIAITKSLTGLETVVSGDDGVQATVRERIDAFISTIVEALNEADQNGAFVTVDGTGDGALASSVASGSGPVPLEQLAQVAPDGSFTNLLNPITLITGNSQGSMPDFLAFFSAVQFAFVQGLEMVLLGAFALFPVIVALMMTAQGGQALTTWVGGVAGLYATQLVYNVTVGVISTFLFNMDIGATTRVSELSFKVFISVIAPLIALNLGYGQFSRAVGGALSTARFLGNRDPALGDATTRDGFR